MAFPAQWGETKAASPLSFEETQEETPINVKVPHVHKQRQHRPGSCKGDALQLSAGCTRHLP